MSLETYKVSSMNNRSTALCYDDLKTMTLNRTLRVSFLDLRTPANPNKPYQAHIHL